jgi:hypothetical protein
VKWCPTQQAFPRSAILTEMVSNAASAACSRSVFDEALLFLSRLMPDTSFVRRSLVDVSSYPKIQRNQLTPSFLVVFGRLLRPRSV